MKPTDRAERLMAEAEKLGCDSPTEAMIAEAINDAEVDAYQDIEISLEQTGFREAAKAVDRWRRRKWEPEGSPAKEPERCYKPESPPEAHRAAEAEGGSKSSVEPRNDAKR